MTLQLLILNFHLTRYDFFVDVPSMVPNPIFLMMEELQVCSKGKHVPIKSKKKILILDCDCSSHKTYVTLSFLSTLKFNILRVHLTPQGHGPSRPSFIFFVNLPYLRLVSGFLPPVSRRMSRSEAILMSC